MANLDREEINRTGAGADDWATEERWWRENYANRPYARADLPFDHYSPAYRYGFEEAQKQRGRQWEDAEKDLESRWDSFRGSAKGRWEDVKDAVKDAWNHVAGGEHERHRQSEGPTASPEVRF